MEGEGYRYTPWLSSTSSLPLNNIAFSIVFNSEFHARAHMLVARCFCNSNKRRLPFLRVIASLLSGKHGLKNVLFWAMRRKKLVLAPLGLKWESKCLFCKKHRQELMFVRASSRDLQLLDQVMRMTRRTIVDGEYYPEICARCSYTSKVLDILSFRYRQSVPVPHVKQS